MSKNKIERHYRQSDKYGYQTKLAYTKVGLDPIANPFNKGNLYSAVIATDFNGDFLQVYKVCKSINIGKINEVFDNLEEEMDMEIQKYKKMLEIDSEYKMHPNHKLRRGLFIEPTTKEGGVKNYEE